MEHLRPAVPGPDLGGRARLRPPAVHRHPRPAVAFQESLFSADRPSSATCCRFYPDLGSDAVRRVIPGEESKRDQVRVGLTMLNDEDHEEFAQLTAGLPRAVRHPADRLRAGRGKRDQILTSGWERMQNSPDPGARRRDHRGGQDRQPPVRRPGRRRQPDPGHGRPGWSASADVRPTGTCRAIDTSRRPAAVQRAAEAEPGYAADLPGRAALGRRGGGGPPVADAAPPSATRPSRRRPASPTRRSTLRWPGTPDRRAGRRGITTPSSPREEQAGGRRRPDRSSRGHQRPATRSTRAGSTGCSSSGPPADRPTRSSPNCGAGSTTRPDASAPRWSGSCGRSRCTRLEEVLAC